MTNTREKAGWLPAVRHWDKPTIPAAVISVMASAIAIVTNKELPGWGSAALAIVVVASGVYQAWCLARESEKAEKEKAILSAAVPQAAPPEMPDYATKVRALSNSALREETFDLTTRLRAFEQTRQEKLVPPPKQISADRVQNWQAQSAQLFRNQAEVQRMFQTEFLRRTLTVEQEINRRIGIERRDWTQDIRTLALTGQLSGPEPAAELANYLDELALKLPIGA